MKKFYLLIFILINLIICDEDDDDDQPILMNYMIDNIYLGGKEAASDEEYLKKYNISTVVNCAEEITSEYKDLRFFELKLYDSVIQDLFPKIEIAYKFIKKTAKKNNNNILIHCTYGKSRSASVVLFYIMNEKKWDYDTCFQYMRARRPLVSPIEHFEMQLREYYDKHINADTNHIHRYGLDIHYKNYLQILVVPTLRHQPNW